MQIFRRIFGLRFVEQTKTLKNYQKTFFKQRNKQTKSEVLFLTEDKISDLFTNLITDLW